MSKVILITGSSSGFGLLTVNALLAKGHKVYATMRNTQSKNKTIAEQLTQQGAHVLDLDVTDDESVSFAINQLLTRESRIDVLINNAGLAAAGISESFSIEQVQRMFDVNVHGVLRMINATLPTFRGQKDGLIINIGSILGRVTFPFFGLYGASKQAIEAISDSFYYELSQLGVEVALVQPSAFPTNMYSNALVGQHSELNASYGHVSAIPVAINETIVGMFNSESAPNPQSVADTIKALIDQPQGQRPRRTVVGLGFGADDANEQIKPIQDGLIHSLEQDQLNTVKTA
jgi:NADP-dependent 3-hydroxy acid dehydrogenase YdfG